jgi:hypothetical protein
MIKLEIIFPQTYSTSSGRNSGFSALSGALCGFWHVPLGLVLLHLQISEVLGDF